MTMSTAIREALGEALRVVADAAARARELPADARSTLLADIDAAVARLTTARADVLLAQRDSGAWRAQGDPTFEAWRARTSRGGLGAAATEVRRGDVLAAMPAMREAVEAGQVTVEHVDVVARTAAGASASVRAGLESSQGQAELLALASRLDAGRFRKAAALMAATLDAAALDRSHEAQRAARFLHLAETPAGTRISGQLDAVAGHRFRRALEAAAGKPSPDDDRSSEQRRADALATLADAVLAAPPGGAPVGPRAAVTLVMREETWLALRGGRGRGPGRDTGTRVGPAGPTQSERSVAGARPRDTQAVAAPPATSEDGAPIPWTEAARMLCDCELTRVVVDAEGQPLDLGRSFRRHTAGQRRAITVRDGGCFWPGCGAPPRWAEVHHLAWWDRDDGPTSVVDGALACSFHHHEVHRRDLTVTRYVLPDAAVTGAESRTRYVVSTSGGRVLADGRPRDDAGRRLGRPARHWVPGRGALEGGALEGGALDCGPPEPAAPVPGLAGAEPSSPAGPRRAGTVPAPREGPGRRPVPVGMAPLLL